MDEVVRTVDQQGCLQDEAGEVLALLVIDVVNLATFHQISQEVPRVRMRIKGVGTHNVVDEQAIGVHLAIGWCGQKPALQVGLTLEIGSLEALVMSNDVFYLGGEGRDLHHLYQWHADGVRQQMLAGACAGSWITGFYPHLHHTCENIFQPLWLMICSRCTRLRWSSASGRLCASTIRAPFPNAQSVKACLTAMPS